MRTKLAMVAGITALAMSGSSASAHHAFAAEFDANKPVNFKGTITKMEWINPHSWLHVMVSDAATGQQGVWALELSSPARLKRMGMSADSVKPGDAISVTFHPLKDGARGGQFLQAVLPDGKQIIRANAGDENAP